MNLSKITYTIYSYIHEFEWEKKRAMTLQEFIDAIPVIYHVIKDTQSEILGKLTKDEFILASQLGYKHQNLPAGIRSQFIQQEYEALRRQR